MNPKNKSVRNRIRKFHEDVERWGTPEAKAHFINQSNARAQAKKDARYLHAMEQANKMNEVL